MGVPDGQAPGGPLDQEELHAPVGGGGRRLGQPGATGEVEGRVVPHRVGVGQGGGQALGGRRGLQHLEAALPEGSGGQGRPDAATEAGQPVADAQHDHRPLVAAPEVVDGHGRDTGGDHVDHLSAGEPRVATGGLQGDPEGAQHQAGLDDGVAGAAQTAQQAAAHRRVDRPDPVGVQELEAARRGVGPAGGLGHQRQLGLVAGDGHRAVGTEPDGGGVDGELLPQLPGPDGEVQFGPSGPPADPHQAEIADRRPPGPGIGLQVDDLPSPAAGLEGVHGAEHATPDDDRTGGVHGWIVARAAAVPDRAVPAGPESPGRCAAARVRSERTAAAGALRVG